MITLYQLYDLTGYHKNSKARWFLGHFGYSTKTAKKTIIKDYDIAYMHLTDFSKKPNLEKLKTFFPDEFKPLDVKVIADKPKEQEPEIEFSVFIKSCGNCFYQEATCLCKIDCKDFDRWLPGKIKTIEEPDFIPQINRDDYKVLLDSFEDIVEMLQKYETRLLSLEKRLELPKRAFRTEVINLVNDIARKYHKPQQELYKEIYQGFDSRYNLKETTRHIKTTFLEWYDKNDYMPKLLNYIKETYKI